MSNEIEELGIIDMNAVRQLMTTNEITKLVLLPQYYTGLLRMKICMSSSGTPHRQFSNKPVAKFHDQ